MALSKGVRLSNGKFMPMVGLGTWQSKSGDEVKKAVKVAIEEGYRHIDTAQLYMNEGDIGEALEEIFKEGKVKREDIFITTKLSLAAMAPENVREQTLISLKKLRASYIDLLLIHAPVAVSNENLHKDPPTLPFYANGAAKTVFIDPLDTWREMEKLVDEGLVRAIGLSNFNKQQLLRMYEKARIKPANIQMECHAWFPQYELVDFCKQRGISFAAYAPIGSPSRPTAIGSSPVLMEEPVIKEIAEKHKKTVAQVLLRNLMQRGIIVLPKSVTPARIKSNYQVFDFELDNDDMEMIKGVNKELQLFRAELYGKQNYLHPFHPWPQFVGNYQPGEGSSQVD